MPEAVPVVVGENTTCNVADWFGPSVRGRLVCPASLKPCPEMVTLETVRADELPFETCTVLVPVCPTTTSPKLTAAGAVSAEEEEAAVDCGDPHPAIIISSEHSDTSSHNLYLSGLFPEVVCWAGSLFAGEPDLRASLGVIAHSVDREKSGMRTSKISSILGFVKLAVPNTQPRTWSG